MKGKKKALLTAVLTIVLCFGLVAGGTFALFTSSYTTSIAVTSANVDVVATVDMSSLKTRSYNDTDWTPASIDNNGNAVGTFANLGTATLTEAGELTILLMTPEDAVRFVVNVDNQSNVPVKYRVRMYSERVAIENEFDDNGNQLYYKDLAPALEVTASIDGADPDSDLNAYVVPTDGTVGGTAMIEVGAGEQIGDITITVKFPDRSDNNDYKNARANIYFVVEAVQGNGDETNL